MALFFDCIFIHLKARFKLSQYIQIYTDVSLKLFVLPKGCMLDEVQQNKYSNGENVPSYFKSRLFPDVKIASGTF